MGFRLDKTESTNKVNVLATLPSGSSGTVILDFFSAYDNSSTPVTVTGVEQRGPWIIMEISDTLVPSRSGQYRIDVFAALAGSVPLKDLHQPLKDIMHPLRDIEGFTRDVMVAQDVGEIVNATNRLITENARSLTFTENSRSLTFTDNDRDLEFNTNY